MSIATKPYGDPARASVLLIGHDPRLQQSDTVAPYSLFADYHFRPKPTKGSESAKYDLAAAVFGMVGWLTGDGVRADEVVVTNLCNQTLPHAPKGRTVLIPEAQAACGIAELHSLLSGSSIRVIIAMSQQVNYWLQLLGFCAANPAFLEAAQPSASGVANDLPFYQQRKPGAFTIVCGRRHEGPGGVPVFPVVHVKSWPLEGPFLNAYGLAHESCRELIPQELAIDRHPLSGPPLPDRAAGDAVGCEPRFHSRR
jgi:hypothetical protein